MRTRYLLLFYLAALIYGSLIPFSAWKDASFLWPGILDLFGAGLPRYWTGFDVITNILIYIPLGLMLSWALQIRWAPWLAGLIASALGAGLALAMESLQLLLPSRVASLLDFLLNGLGAILGAALAATISRENFQDWCASLLKPWSKHYATLDTSGQNHPSRWIFSLIFLWLIAQISPYTANFALGDFHLESWHQAGLSAGIDAVYTPFFESLGAALSVLVIGLLVQALRGRRDDSLTATLFIFFLAILLKGICAAVLLGSSAAFGWFSAASQGGVLIGLGLLAVASMALRSRQRQLWWVLLVALGISVALGNLLLANDYHRPFSSGNYPKQWRALEGLLFWTGALWPLATIVLSIRQLGKHRYS